MFFIKILFFLIISLFESTGILAEVSQLNKSVIDIDYLNSKDYLKNYILGAGDELYIKFDNIPEISKNYKINEEGEIFFNRIDETYVNGLTISELEVLLEKRFKEFIIDPDISIKINKFKPVRVLLKGEVKNPSVVVLNSFYESEENSFDDLKKSKNFDIGLNESEKEINFLSSLDENEKFESFDYISPANPATLTNAIKLSGGLTSYSDIANIEIIRNNPLGKGGGKIRAFISLTEFLNGEFSTNQDIRLFDGDFIIIPRLSNPDESIVSKSIITGLTPKYIKVFVSGKTSNPGTYILPIKGTLSDAMNLSGPNIPFSGKTYLISYNRDGSLSRSKIKYSLSAKPGSSKNPFLKNGDFITIQESSYGRFARSIKVLTDPLRGIYISKELFEDIF